MNLFENIQRIREMMELDSSSEGSKYYIGNSKLGGEGVFAKQRINKGDVIGLLHTIIELRSKYDFTELGRKYNHQDKPNCYNKLIDNQRFLVALRDIEQGEELTADYRLQPDLEQPKSSWNR